MVTDIPESGKKAAHIVLDMVSAFDPDGDDERNTAAMNLAFHRMNEVGAVTATFDEEANTLDVDGSNMMGGLSVLVMWLVTRTADLSGVTKHDVIVKAREFVNEVEPG